MVWRRGSYPRRGQGRGPLLGTGCARFDAWLGAGLLIVPAAIAFISKSNFDNPRGFQVVLDLLSVVALIGAGLAVLISLTIRLRTPEKGAWEFYRRKIATILQHERNTLPEQLNLRGNDL